MSLKPKKYSEMKRDGIELKNKMQKNLSSVGKHIVIFDNTQYSAMTRKDCRTYKTAWSNECIELWFLLHFQELTSNIGRKQYRQLLRKYCGYEKNMENIYDVLKDKTDIALIRAKRQYEAYGDMAPSKMCPATRVFELVEELKSYL